jgi:hypothetical protein
LIGDHCGLSALLSNVIDFQFRFELLLFLGDPALQKIDLFLVVCYPGSENFYFGFGVIPDGRLLD